jgi:hypothetical protein
MELIIRRNWDFREFRVRVNQSTPIHQLWIPIWHQIASISDLPNPIRQVVTLISDIRLYPLHGANLHPPFLSFSSTTLPSSQNLKFSNPSLSLYLMMISWQSIHHLLSTGYTEYRIHQALHTPSTAYTEYSIHQVQHTPSTAYTEYSIHWV